MKKGHENILFLVTIITISALFGCGSSGGSPDATAPLISAVTPSNQVLGKDDAIVIRFSESMNTNSLVLGGELTAESGAATWNVSNDIVTIQPQARWKSGQNRAFTLEATDVAGNPLDAFSTTFLVPMEFDIFQAAEVVIGQSDFTLSSGAPNDSKIGGSYGNVAVAEGRLFIGDYSLNRVLGYNAVPQANGAAADFVLGQPDFDTYSSGTSRSTMSGPQQISTEGGKMVIAEYDNSRVLIYNSIPRDGSALPDVVVGQDDFESTVSTCDATHMSSVETAVIAAGKLIVTDSGNKRVLIWNSIPTSNNRSPDLVLGQSTFDKCQANDDDQNGLEDLTASARTMAYPAGVWSDGTRLIVADSSNNRVLLWNTFPTANFQPADIVLGQANFNNKASNDKDGNGLAGVDGPSARTLNYPYDGVWSNGVQVFVADTYNNRVLIWNSWPQNNFAPADVVLGQGAFTNWAPNDADQDGTEDGQPSAAVLSDPKGVFGYRDLLFITDFNNSRILVFRSN
jgi:hypothetical protein